MTGPFQGVSVLELASGIAGPYCGMLLADLGADVTKAEPPHGDPARGSPAFHVWNRGKRSVIADAQSEEDRRTIRRLAGGSHVVIADLPPGQGEAVGLDYETLAGENPALVYCHMPPFGDKGPHAGRCSDDALVAAVGGVTGRQPSHSGAPVFVTIPASSYGAAMLAASAIGVALRVQERSGRGQKVTVSWVAGALAMQTGSLVGAQEWLSPLGLAPLLHQPQGVVPVYRLYKAQDDWLFLACGNPTFWAKLCIALDKPELVADPRFENAPWGVVNAPDREALYNIIAPILAEKPRSYWLEHFERSDVPAAPVLTRAEFIDDPQVVHNGMRVELDDPTLGHTVQMGIPLKFARTPGSIREAAPLLGQHSEEVLRELPARQEPRSAATARGHGDFALEGVRVVDLTNYIAGSLCPMFLADYGAQVTKVEPLQGDSFRMFGLGFMGWNRGKRSVTLDLTQREGQRLLRELVGQADVVVENFRPGVAQRLGADYETLAQVKSDIIYCSIAGHGETGPRAARPAFDPLLQARSGAMAAQGGHGQPPVYLDVAITDYSAALLGSYGIAAALYERERSGEGQRVVTSLTAATIAGQSGSFIFYEGKPEEPEGGPDFLGPSAACRCYQAADGWLFLACRSEEQWQALAYAVGRPELAQPHSWQTAASAPAQDGLGRVLEGIFGADTVDKWLARLDSAGVPCAPILGPLDLLTDEHLVANDLITDHKHAQWGLIRQTGVLVKLSRTPGCLQGPSPNLSQHTDEVLTELGYDQKEIARLREGRVVA
ncbi:MAG: CoA transferase [Dehalococcoidia bacterium]|nr:MAG: CoA transferase [Dehalococcoidia bacterium]